MARSLGRVRRDRRTSRAAGGRDRRRWHDRRILRAQHGRAAGVAAPRQGHCRHPRRDGRGNRRIRTGSVELATEVADMGYDALLVTARPMPSRRRANALHALAVDRAANLPIILYNYPGRMAAEMSEEYLDRVGRSRSPSRKARATSTNPHAGAGLPVSRQAGMDDQALEFFAWGAESWICADRTRPRGAYRPVEDLRCGRRLHACTRSCRRCCR